MVRGLKTLFKGANEVNRDKVRQCLREKKSLRIVEEEIAKLGSREREMIYREFWQDLSDFERRDLVKHFFNESIEEWLLSFSRFYEEEQIRILEILAYFDEARVVDFIWTQVNSPREMVGVTATWALRRRRPIEIQEKIKEILEGGGKIVPSRLWELIRELDQKSSLNFLLFLLDNPDLKGELILLQILGEMGDEIFYPVFERLADSRDIQVRRKTVLALKESKLGEISLPLFKKLLNDEDWSVRLQALEGVKFLKGTEVISILKEKKSSEEHPLVKKVLEEMLNQFEGGAATGKLE